MSSARKFRLFPVCLLLAACAAAPPPAPAPKPAAPSVPLLIATPQDDSAPAALEARLTTKNDSQVLLRFTVQEDGKVRDARVLMSKLPEDTTAAVVGAFSVLRFKPYQDHGRPVSHEFIYPLFFGPNAVSEHTRFLCRHEDERYRPDSRCDIVTTGNWRVYRVTPPYPAGVSPAVSGRVTLAFDLDSGGVPSNVKVVKAEPPGTFDTAAVVALQQWYFESLDGSALASAQHATVTVNFTPPAAKPAGGP
ncbi:MAG: energy transducer TonB [Bacillota bacterium]